MTTNQLIRIIRIAGCREGRLIPATPAEVAAFEEWMAEQPPIELPESLRDPHAVLIRRPSRASPAPRRPSTPAACAAPPSAPGYAAASR